MSTSVPRRLVCFVDSLLQFDCILEAWQNAWVDEAKITILFGQADARMLEAGQAELTFEEDERPMLQAALDQLRAGRYVVSLHVEHEDEARTMSTLARDCGAKVVLPWKRVVHVGAI